MYGQVICLVQYTLENCTKTPIAKKIFENRKSYFQQICSEIPWIQEIVAGLNLVYKWSIFAVQLVFGPQYLQYRQFFVHRTIILAKQIVWSIIFALQIDFGPSYFPNRQFLVLNICQTVFVIFFLQKVFLHLFVNTYVHRCLQGVFNFSYIFGHRSKCLR